MDSLMTLILIMWGFFCLCFGFWLSRMYFLVAFKAFSEEMHRQYLMLLEKHGIKPNDRGELMLRGHRK
jgi:hypothetical protein